MKRTKIILVLLAVCLVTGCDDDIDNLFERDTELNHPLIIDLKNAHPDYKYTKEEFNVANFNELQTLIQCADIIKPDAYTRHRYIYVFIREMETKFHIVIEKNVQKVLNIELCNLIKH